MVLNKNQGILTFFLQQIHNQIHFFLIQNTPERKERRIFNFLKNDKKCKSFQRLSPTFHLEGWAKHFEYEHIIKLSKNKIESRTYQLFYNNVDIFYDAKITLIVVYLH